ncbi:MAG: metallopeptidase family protein [Bacteroidales bacterium]|nr:metallopeptidase family protein [Bacteroidales bacterium]
MEKEEFENLVAQAAQELPQKILDKLQNVVIAVQDVPDDYQLHQGGYTKNQFLLGLYEGVPLLHRDYYNRVLPDKITLFQKNIESFVNNDPQAVKKTIKNTLWHEIGHHFGFTDKELNKLSI